MERGINTKITQYTEEYWKIRAGEPGKYRINASEASVAANANHYVKVVAFFHHLLAKKNGTEQEKQTYLASTVPLESTQEIYDTGHRIEPHAIELYTKLTGRKVSEGYYWISRKDSRFAASPDGIVHDPKTGEEIAIIEAKHTSDFKNMKYIDDEHIWQMQFQLMVTGFPYADYIKVYRKKDATPKDEVNIQYYLLKRVYRSDIFINWMLEKMQWLLTSLEKGEMQPKVPYWLYQHDVINAMFLEFVAKYVKIETIVPQ